MGEERSAPAEEGLDTLAGVGARQHAEELLMLGVEPGREISHAGRAHRPLGGLHRHARHAGEPRGERQRVISRLASGSDLVDEAQLCRPHGPEQFPGQDQRRGPAPADTCRKSLGSARTGDQAEGDFREPQPCPLIRDDHITAERQLEPAADRRRLDSGDHGLVEPLDQPKGLAGERRVVGDLGVRAEHPLELPEIGTGSERLLTAPRDDDRAYPVAFTQLGRDITQPLEDFVAERVDGGSVDLDERHSGVLGQADGHSC